MAPLIVGALAFLAAAAPYAQDASLIVTGVKAAVSIPCLVIEIVDPPQPSWCASVATAVKAAAHAPVPAAAPDWPHIAYVPVR